MKTNYIRIFFLSLILVMSFFLFNEFELFNKTLPSQEFKKEQPSQLSSINYGNDTYNDLVNDGGYKSFIFGTPLFKDIQISSLNGSIKNLSLIGYHDDVNGDVNKVLLNSNIDSQYVAFNVIILNGKALNVLFKHENTIETSEDVTITLSASLEGVNILRNYVFSNNNYIVNVNQQIKNTNEYPINISFVNETSKKHVLDKSSFNLFKVNSYFFDGIGYVSNHDTLQKKSFDELRNNLKQFEMFTNLSWLSFIQHYFVSICIPDNHGQPLKIYTSRDNNSLYRGCIVTAPISLDAHEVVLNSNSLYLGPLNDSNIKSFINSFIDNKPYSIYRLIDYGILSFISIIIFWLMNIIFSVIGNWGFSIIFVTFIIKFLFYPLSAKSYKSMARMRLLQPQIKKIQIFYKDDRRKLAQEIAALYKKENVSALSGCLPVFVQIPVFIALYWVLLESIQFRHAPFIFWINDLSAKDPYYILPILMGISMFLQQKLTPVVTDNPLHAKITMFIPIIFTFLFASFPSGLILYWLTNNVISIFQQWYFTRSIH